MLKQFKQEGYMIPFLIYLFTCYQHAKALTDQLTEFGHRVTINCDLEDNEVYWLLLNLPNPPVTILRSFSTSETPFYYNMTFRSKYSIKSKHLLINSVTVDELGVYYCMNTGIFPKFSNGTRLHVIEPSQVTEFTECQNHTIVRYIQQNHTVMSYTEQNQTQWKTVIIIAAVLTGVMVFVAIGSICHYPREQFKSPNTDLKRTRFMPPEQCTEVTLSLMYEEFEALPQPKSKSHKSVL